MESNLQGVKWPRIIVHAQFAMCLQKGHACSYSMCQMVRCPLCGVYVNTSSAILSISGDDKFLLGGGIVTVYHGEYDMAQHYIYACKIYIYIYICECVCVY